MQHAAYSLLESLKAPAEANAGREPRTAKRANNAAILGANTLQNCRYSSYWVLLQHCKRTISWNENIKDIVTIS